MSEPVSVRPATRDDIPAMSRVLIASITELCHREHRNDPALIADWTANKTPAGLAKFFDNPEVALFVAERTGEIAAVGCIGHNGWIRLNYVAPGHRFTGVSKALLAAMEAALRQGGIADAHLHSTKTAHRFYQAAGWIDDGAPDLAGQMPSYPMRKRL